MMLTRPPTRNAQCPSSLTEIIRNQGRIVFSTQVQWVLASHPLPKGGFLERVDRLLGHCRRQALSDPHNPTGGSGVPGFTVTRTTTQTQANIKT